MDTDLRIVILYIRLIREIRGYKMLVRFKPSIDMRCEPISQIKQVTTNKQTQVSKFYFSILIRA